MGREREGGGWKLRDLATLVCLPLRSRLVEEREREEEEGRLRDLARMVCLGVLTGCAGSMTFFGLSQTSNVCLAAALWTQ